MTPPARARLRVPMMSPPTSLCETLDRLLDTGIVVAGDIRIKVADVPLLVIRLELLACSWETARSMESGRNGTMVDGWERQS